MNFSYITNQFLELIKYKISREFHYIFLLHNNAKGILYEV